MDDNKITSKELIELHRKFVALLIKDAMAYTDYNDISPEMATAVSENMRLVLEENKLFSY